MMGVTERETVPWLMGANVLVCGSDPARVGAIASEIARAGALVVLPRLRGQSGAWRDTIRAVGATGRVPLEMAGDLDTVAGIEAFVRQSLRAIGHIDGLVCDAPPVDAGGLAGLEDPGWSEGLRQGLKLPFFLAKAVGLSMVEANGGRIVIVADREPSVSRDGVLASVVSGARMMMAQVLSRALAPRISVCAVVGQSETGTDETTSAAAPIRERRFTVDRWAKLGRQVRLGLEDGGSPGVVAFG